MPDSANPLILDMREGVVTGMAGAVIVALFYFGFDLVRGTPLMTPSVLGQVLLFGNPDPVIAHPEMSAVALYTFAHLFLFAAFGLFLSGLARLAERNAIARYGALQLLVAFLFAFYGVLAFASEITRGLFPFWSVLAANALAAAGMAFYLWRRHPALAAAIRRTPLGAADAHG